MRTQTMNIPSETPILESNPLRARVTGFGCGKKGRFAFAESLESSRGRIHRGDSITVSLGKHVWRGPIPKGLDETVLLWDLRWYTPPHTCGGWRAMGGRAETA